MIWDSHSQQWWPQEVQQPVNPRNDPPLNQYCMVSLSNLPICLTTSRPRRHPKRTSTMLKR